MLLTSIRRAPFLDLLKGNCSILKEIILFRYSPFYVCLIKFLNYYSRVQIAQGRRIRRAAVSRTLNM